MDPRRPRGGRAANTDVNRERAAGQPALSPRSSSAAHGTWSERHAATLATLMPLGAVPAGSLLRLQRLAGNRAVQALMVQRAGPAPAPYSPPQGMIELGATNPSGRPLGETHPRSAPAPQWALEGGSSGGRYSATVRSVTLGSPVIDATYPAPGVYNLPPNTAGTPRRALVDDGVSLLVRDAEQEHSDDFWWAHQLAYEPVVAAINLLASRPAKQGANIREVNAAWLEELSALLPPALRFPVDVIAPSGNWSQVYGRLLSQSHERDSQGWHTMRQGFGTHEDRQAHSIPDGVDLIRVLQNAANINVHAPEARARAAFAALPPGR